jgi:hypothetical protein
MAGLQRRWDMDQEIEGSEKKEDGRPHRSAFRVRLGTRLGFALFASPF